MKAGGRKSSSLFLGLITGVCVIVWALAFGATPLTRGRQKPASGKLTGKVRQGHACEKKQGDKPCPSEPATGVHLRISTSSGKEVKSVLTDNYGIYEISLPPGTYRIEMLPPARGGTTRDLPATVPVVAGEEKSLDIFIETGNAQARWLGASGVLVGNVTAGPMSPVAGIGHDRQPVPVAGARLVISRLDGQEVKSVLTDDRGAYSVVLPAGTCRIEMASPTLRVGRGARNLPATITISEGKETRLDIFVDTGIR
jgi:hypothetical protein